MRQIEMSVRQSHWLLFHDGLQRKPGFEFLAELAPGLFCDRFRKFG